MRLDILVVDDIRASRQALSELVSELGHQPTAVDSGLAALAQVQQRRPDLVLLDLLMPDLDGFEVTRRLREQSGDRWLPVIVTSSLHGDEHFIRALHSGADDDLSRPVNAALRDAMLRGRGRLPGGAAGRAASWAGQPGPALSSASSAWAWRSDQRARCGWLRRPWCPGSPSARAPDRGRVRQCEAERRVPAGRVPLSGLTCDLAGPAHRQRQKASMNPVSPSRLAKRRQSRRQAQPWPGLRRAFAASSEAAGPG